MRRERIWSHFLAVTLLFWLPLSHALQFGSSQYELRWIPSLRLVQEMRDPLSYGNGKGENRTLEWFDFSGDTWGNATTLQIKLRKPRSPSICILMSDSRPHVVNEVVPMLQAGQNVPYWHATVYMNINYAMRHGYDFYRVGLPEKTIRHPSWHKLPLIKAMLFKYDYVFFVDSDAYFREQNVSVEYLIGHWQLDKDKHLLINRNHIYVPTEIANAGVMLFRAGQQIFEMIDYWWWFPYDHLEWSLWGQYWEQTCFNDHPDGVYDKFQHVISLADFGYMTSPQGKIVRHMWSGENDENRRTELVMQAVAHLFMGQLHDNLFHRKHLRRGGSDAPQLRR